MASNRGIVDAFCTKIFLRRLKGMLGVLIGKFCSLGPSWLNPLALAFLKFLITDNKYFHDVCLFFELFEEIELIVR